MKWFLITLFLFILPLCFASENSLKECQRVQLSKDIPCTIYASFLPSAGCSADVDIFQENGTSLGTEGWESAAPTCSFLWNISNKGNYRYNSSIETGVITIVSEDNMLAIIISFIFIIGLFLFMAHPHKLGVIKFSCYALGLIEFITMVFVLYIKEAGFDILEILRWNAFGVLILGGAFGLLSIYKHMLNVASLKDGVVKDDSYTKWIND